MTKHVNKRTGSKNMVNNARGQIDEAYFNDHKSDSYTLLISEWKDPDIVSSELTAVIRIIGLNFFKKNEKTIAPIFLNLLNKGCPLYTKLELQSALSTGNYFTADLLVEKLGTIGNNQHLSVPLKTSRKPSYPIARDICARVLQKMDEIAVCCICMHMRSGTLTDSMKSEALDVLGYCIFHNENLASVQMINLILHETNSENMVIKWKAIRALSSFKGNHIVENHLLSMHDEQNVPTINNEIIRSLSFVDGTRS